MEAAGADMIDIGGESTRPGAVPLSADEELARVAPVLRGLAGRLRVPISIDTYKAAVAEAALDLGASIVNDISALEYDPALPAVVARTRAAVDPHAHARALAGHVPRRPLRRRRARGVARSSASASAAPATAGIPAVARARRSGDWLREARRAQRYAARAAARSCTRSVVRSSWVPRESRSCSAPPASAPPAARDWATAAAVTAAVLAGAHVVRVHAVPEMVDVVRMADMLRRDAGDRPGEQGGSEPRELVQRVRSRVHPSAGGTSSTSRS